MTTATPSTEFHLVVGNDDSPPASPALDGAARLLHGRIGRIDVVYVAHLSSLDMPSHGAIAEWKRTSTRSSRSFAPKPPGSCAPAGPPGSSSGAAHYRAVEAAEPTGAGPGAGHRRPCLASPRLCGAALPGSPLAPPFGRRRLVSGWTGGLGRRGMSDGPGGPGPDGGGAPHHPEGGPRVLERLDASECLQLIGGGRLGRLAYTGRFGPTVLPVLCKVAFGGSPVRCGNPRRVGRAGRGARRIM